MIPAALVTLFPEGGVVEVRALADRFAHSGYFDDFAKLANAAEALDADLEVKGTYVTLNVVDPALLARRANRVKMRLTRSDPTTSDADILRRRWLPIDLDPVRPSGVSSTEAEHAAALQRAETIARWLAEQGFSDPIMADSGNGAHLLYAIDLPNDEAATALVKRVLVTLDALFSDDLVTVDTANFNAARIWKLYGTCSRKGDHTPDRPHRRAKILLAPDHPEVVGAGLLREIAGRLPIEAPVPPRKGKAGIDLGAWLREHGLAVRNTRPWQGGTLYVLEDCPFSGAHHDGAFAVQFPSGAIYAGCHHASCGGGTQRWPELRDRYEPREKRSRKKREEVPPPPPVPPAPDPAYREEAMEILEHGDPLAFLLDTFAREHVGDRIVAECLVMSLASQSVENTSGLHVSVSGNSGKGKSHACTTMLKQVPAAYRLAGTVSNKALYYHDDLRPGTVFLFDDVSLSDDLQEVLKAATANFRDHIEHHTVSPDRKIQVCRLPERCVWWLARVEDPGDDQVMNRMLTVWIDDSLEQDERVLEHMKHAEAREAAEGDAEDPGLPVCRAMWEVLKEERLHVSIPYAEQVQFSATANRRNPGMLFDLIKASALLHRFQRERYEGGIRANREDFETAARIYVAINGEAGGQETKVTKNEAAALETVATMGWDQFTVRMLQEALGLSYQQTYRILHGYASRGSTYSGLLEKCPAISYLDTTVTEDQDGCVVRRREHLFLFDRGGYRRWARGAAVWIAGGGDDEGHDRDDDPGPGPQDTFSIPAGFQQNFSRCREDQSMQDDVRSDSISTDRETRLSLSTKLQQNPHPPTPPGSSVSGCGGGCDPRNVESDLMILPGEGAKRDLPELCSPLNVGTFRKLLKTAEKKGSVLKERSGAIPLPGVLDHREFTRVSTDLGRCDVCAEGKAVHRSGDGRVVLCEGCYARLVREWNMGKGIS
ncbi:hypothetical protein E2N92_01705 [Methanofollis formosanus]|uniref:Uncharacterized protein n=1 Tax=Methanofollis formosanus TaxID=299308 RepID=A0A8G1A030_9EURY|nr:hypothetical protein [Methanofollis formosanus]QYZ78233.1 hypothetical protein E2N92_01705 [Methanofollis formosanus]